MTQGPSAGRPTDADLVAYLDQELEAEHRAEISTWLESDAELRERLVTLAHGARSFRDAYGALLAEAPLARMQTMLGGLLDEHPATAGPARPAPARRSPGWHWPNLSLWARPSLVAAGLALFLLGAGTDRWVTGWRGAAETEASEESDWRQAVAEYISLYSHDTLAAIPDDAAPQQRELAMVGAKLGLALPLDQVALPGLTLKRAQLLEYDGKPLAQLAYLDPKSGVLALCIYNDMPHDAPAQSEQRAGLNIVHWSAHGRAFMLVGHAETAELQRFASLLSQKTTL